MVPDSGGEPTVDDLPNILAPNLRRFEPSGWHELVAVAHWLVAALRPRVLVGLGTHAGVSFGAFCGAVQRLGLTTRAFAIDRWTGDSHAGGRGQGGRRRTVLREAPSGRSVLAGSASAARGGELRQRQSWSRSSCDPARSAIRGPRSRAVWARRTISGGVWRGS